MRVLLVRIRLIVLAVAAASMVPFAAFAANPIQIENAKPGDTGWDAYPEAHGEIEGYASAPSVNRGDSISFYVNTSESTYTLEIYRTGWYGGAGARRVLGPIARAGVSQVIPSPNPTTGIVECNWTDPYTITIPNTPDPTDWCSGAYVVLLTSGTTGHKKYIFFVVRDDSRISNHYFQSAVNTAEAYNPWGGKSLYSFNSGCTGSTWRNGCSTSGTPAVKVSFNRPFQDGGGTGDYLWNWEYNMVRFMEREGYDVTYSTSLDTSRRGSLLLNHRDFLSVGHDEYWQWDARQNVQNALNSKVNLGFFSANGCYWQIRYEPSSTGVPDRTIVGYKEVALTKDPYATDKDSSNDHLVTTNWRSSPVNMPESALVGVQYVYDQSNLADDVVIDNTTSAPWVFAGSGATTGTHLTGLLGYEIDAMAPQSPAGTIRIGHSPFLNKKVTPNTTQYSDMTVYTAPSGGIVFATGTIQWAWGLDDYNSAQRPNAPVSPIAQQITRNVLQKFAGSSAVNDCTYTVSPTSVSVTGAAGSGSFAVSTGGNCPWQPQSDSPWLTITAGASNSGNGSLSYAFSGNSGAARVGKIRIGDATFTVTQAGCSFSLSKTAQSFTSGSGTDSIAVSTTSGCVWGASAADPWITITSGASGDGSGTVTYSVAANSGPARDSVLTIAGIAVSIHQSGGCNFTASPSTATYSSAAAQGSIALTASNASCPWTATSSAPSVTIAAPASGNGNATISYSVAANSGNARDAVITAGGMTITIHQASGCSYTVSPASASVSAVAQSVTITLTTSGSDCPWTSASSATWATFTAAAGTGNTTATVNVAANSGAARDAVLTIGGKSVALHQASGCTYTASPASFSLGAAAGTGSVTLGASGSDCPWTAAASPAWVTITSATSGTGPATVAFSVAANTGPARDATLTAGGQSVAIHQASGCSYTIAPASSNFTSSGGSGTATVTASAPACAWTATTNAPSWITLTTPSGTGSGTVGYSVSSNAGPARDGLITLNGQSVAVHQAGGCTYSIQPASASIGSAASSGRIDITTSAPTCPWTTATSAAWTYVTSATTGTGNGSINYSADPNAGAARDATITVGGQTFALHQASGCGYSLSAPSATFSAPAAQSSVTLSATAADCPWTASSSATWITITSATSGKGGSTINYSVAANAGPDRDAALTIAGQTYSVHQTGGCTFTLSAANATYGATASQGSVTMTASSPACGWTASSAAPWVTITSAASGSGSATITYNVAANNGPDRDGVLTIAGQTLAIHQTTGCSVTLSPASASVGSAAASGQVGVTASSSGCAWTATSSAAWAQIGSGASGSGNGTVTYNTGTNTGAARDATITIGGKAFALHQADGCSYSLSATSATYPASAAQSSVTLSTTSTDCPWTVSSAAPWITITSAASGSGSATIAYSVAANNGPDRDGVLTIAGQNVAVHQSSGCTLTATPASATFTAAAGSGSVTTAMSNGSCPWTASSSATWVKITSATSGTGNATLTYTVDANPGVARDATIAIGSTPVAIHQAGGCAFTLSATSATYTSAAATGSIGVTATSSSCSWTASSAAPWITITSAASGTGSTTVTYGVAANNGPDRDGVLTIAGQNVAVHQTSGCTSTATPASATYTASAGSGSVTIAASNAGCPWTASSSATWVKITSPTSGTGNATLTYTVDANPGVSRDATISIGSTPVAIHQSSGCGFTLSATSATYTSTAATGSIGVTATSSSCSWTASSAAPWITITSTASGMGSATIAYSVAANNGPDRDGVLTIAGQNVAVYQTSGCTLTAAPASATFTAAAGSGSVTIATSNGSCPWTASSNATWVNITSATSGTGNATLTYIVDANAGVARDASIMVGGVTVQVHQAGNCSFGLSASSATYSPAAATGSVNLTASSAECPWSASSSATWLTISSATSGAGNATIAYSVAANSGPQRDAVLSAGGQSLAIHQDGGCSFSASPSSGSFGASASQSSIAITASSPACSWTAASGASWVTFETSPTGTGNGTVAFTVAANPGAARDTVLTVGGVTIPIHQSTGCTVTIDPTTATFGAAGGSQTVTVTASSSDCAWNAESSAAWVTVRGPSSGLASGSVTLDIAANNGNVRDAIVTIGGQELAIHQSTGCAYTSTPTSFSLSNGGGNGLVSIATDGTCYWSSSTAASWISLTSGTEGKGPGSTGFSVAPNTTGAARKSYIIVAGTVITIDQAGSETAPTSVSAVATSATSVRVTWASGPSGSSYEIYRQSTIGNSTLVGTTSANSFDDATASPNTAYAYSVRAISGGTPSPMSAADLATTVMFTDSPLAPGVPIKAVHLAEIRTAINAVRTLAGLSAFSFTDQAVRGVPVKAVHIQEMRTALDQAFDALHITHAAYSTDVTAGSAVRATDFQELRDRVR